MKNLIAQLGEPKVPASELRQRADRVADLARDVGFPVQEIGCLTLPSGPELITGNGESWWLANVEEDPDFKKGALPVPTRVISDLQKLHQAGVEFQRIFIAHELPPGAQVYVPQNTSAVGTGRAADQYGRAAELAMNISIAPLAAIIEAGKLATTPVSAVDPILFGAVTASNPAKDGDMAILFFLAAWEVQQWH